MSVILTVSKNAGAASSGAIIGAEGDSFQLSAASKSGWVANSARFEISDFPEDFEQPAGWSTDGTTGAYYYATNNGDPPAFTVPVGQWGKFMLSLRATDGATVTTDTSTAIDVRSSAGHSNIGRGEGAIFGGAQKRWAGELQRFIKDLGDRVSLSLGDAVSFFPTADADADTDAFEALLNAGSSVVGYGTLKLTRPLVVTASGWQIIRSPELPFTISQHATWSGSGVASTTNAMLRLAEVEAATAATTPSSAKTAQFSPSVALTSATGYTAGTYFKTLGISGSNDYFGQSAGANCPSEELLQVDSEAGGTVTHRITQTRHIGQNNASAPHKTLKLLTSAVDGCAIRGVRFDAYQDGAAPPTLPVVACAISASFARRVVLEDVKVKGFVYAAIYGRGCRDWFGRDVVNLGATNRRMHFFSSQNIDIVMDDVLDVYERTNTRGGASGLFYAWVWQSQCHRMRLRGTIQHAPAGVLAWAGDHCELDVDVRDIRFQEIGLSVAGIPEDNGGGRRGYVLDTVANDVPTAEFGRHNTYRVRWADCHSGTAKYWPGGSDVPQHWFAAVYLHDNWDCVWDLKNSDLGRDPATSTAYRWVGCVTQDVSGEVRSFLRGFVKGMLHIGTQNSLRIERYDYFAGAGDGSTGYAITGNEAAITIDEGSGGLPQYLTVQANTYHLVDFYSSFAFPLSGYKATLISHCPKAAVLYDSGVYEARDIRIARLPNSASYAGVCRAHTIDDASASDSETRIATAPTAAPVTGAFVSLTINHNNAGTLRPTIGVLGSPTAVTPIYCAASTTLGARAFVESDASGFAVAAANGADDLATLRRVIGRARYKRVTSGSPNFMQLG